MEKKENKFEGIFEIEDILGKFYSFCLVDLQLEKSTTLRHLSRIRKFLKKVKKPIELLTREDIRNYLLTLRGGNPYTYSNELKSLRRFFGDFLGRKELIQTFKFPSRPPILKKVPPKEELKRFYENLESLREKAIFLLIASSGLRRSEALDLRLSDVDFERRMLLPNHDSRTKRSYITFYNEEAEEVLKQWLKVRPKNRNKLFPMKTDQKHQLFVKTRKKTGIKISPQVLREWFACEMGRLSVPDRFVDAFCGRVPKSILARHYTDFSPEKLREIYDKANIKVLV